MEGDAFFATDDMAVSSSGDEGDSARERAEAEEHRASLLALKAVMRSNPKWIVHETPWQRRRRVCETAVATYWAPVCFLALLFAVVFLSALHAGGE